MNRAIFKRAVLSLFSLGFLAFTACLAGGPGAQPTVGTDAAVSSGATTPAGAPSGGGELVPDPVSSGTVARADGGGIVSAPSSREEIEEAIFKVKALYWKPDARRPWRDAADFFDKLNRGLLTDEIFASTEAQFLLLDPVYILEEREDGEWGGYLGVNEAMVRSQIIDKITEPGYYLVFMAVRENFFEEKAPKKPITTAEEVKAFANDPEARFVDEKLISSRVLHPEILRSRPLIELPIIVH